MLLLEPGFRNEIHFHGLLLGLSQGSEGGKKMETWR